jgi:hypothetical protein
MCSLNLHLGRLEESGYIISRNGFRGAQTQNHLSNCGRQGRKALSEYVPRHEDR